MGLEANEIEPPKNIGTLTRPDSPQLIKSNNIFEYMNGAGELYLAYRFHHLEVFEYTGKGDENILVELYFLETSDDAFGLLSLDWTGEPVFLSDGENTNSTDSISPSISALYGAGLLRLRSDNLYVRILANNDTPEFSQAVLNLGRSIIKGRRKSSEPEILRDLPLRIDPVWKLRKDRISFFRSYLILNSIYYLSHENILDLDHSAEAVMVSYELNAAPNTSERCRLLLLKYENPEKAWNGLNHFQKSYLPEKNHKPIADSARKGLQTYKVEDGWMGYKLLRNYLTLVFECPDRDSVEMIIHKIESNLMKKEGSNEE